MAIAPESIMLEPAPSMVGPDHWKEVIDLRFAKTEPIAFARMDQLEQLYKASKDFLEATDTYDESNQVLMREWVRRRYVLQDMLNQADAVMAQQEKPL